MTFSREKKDLKTKKKTKKKTLRCFNHAGATLTREDNGTPHIRDVYRSRLSLMLHSTNNIFGSVTIIYCVKTIFNLKKDQKKTSK